MSGPLAGPQVKDSGLSEVFGDNFIQESGFVGSPDGTRSGDGTINSGRMSGTTTTTPQSIGGNQGGGSGNMGALGSGSSSNAGGRRFRRQVGVFVGDPYAGYGSEDYGGGYDSGYGGDNGGTDVIIY